MDVRINGIIVPDEDLEFYEWFGWSAFAPKRIHEAIREANGDRLDVYINSNGGAVTAGSEIYEAIRQYKGAKMIHVVGVAHSAASVIACAAESEMAPTALMMVHCASGYTCGNHNEMEKTAEILRTVDKALAAAYREKSGMEEGEILQMMEVETWLTAEDAVAYGLIDKVSAPETGNKPLAAAAAVGFGLADPKAIEDWKRQQAEKKNNAITAAEVRLKYLELMNI